MKENSTLNEYEVQRLADYWIQFSEYHWREVTPTTASTTRNFHMGQADQAIACTFQLLTSLLGYSYQQVNDYVACRRVEMQQVSS